jgi:hypothetical protein
MWFTRMVLVWALVLFSAHGWVIATVYSNQGCCRFFFKYFSKDGHVFKYYQNRILSPFQKAARAWPIVEVTFLEKLITQTPTANSKDGKNLADS